MHPREMLSEGCCWARCSWLGFIFDRKFPSTQPTLKRPVLDLSPRSTLKVGDPAAPRTSRAHEHAIPQPIGPHLNVCCVLCIRVPSFRMFGHLFMDARASLGFIALGADFMNPKHHMHIHICFGFAGAISMLWIGLFGWLPCFCDSTSSIPGANPMTPKKVRMSSEDSKHISARMSLPRPVGGSPRIQNMACDSDLLLENSRHQNIEYDRIEVFTA
jgi:hypothetical protein